MPSPTNWNMQLNKLGHNLEEIRVRALKNLISKLDRGVIKENDYVVRRGLFLKLLEWFDFEACPEKDRALAVILDLLKGKVGNRLLAEVGSSRVLQVLNTVQSDGDHDITVLVGQIKALISDRDAESNVTRPSETPRYAFDTGSERSSVFVEEFRPERSTDDAKFSGNTNDAVHTLSSQNCFQYLVLPWQPLVATDRHVLSSVEGSLSALDQPEIVLHSCNFFMNVMLQDFPAEVFLQRPEIVTVLLTNLRNTTPGSNKKVSSSIIKCLHKLTVGLIGRIFYYSDPSVSNLKQQTCTNISMTPSCESHTSSYIFDAEEYFPHEHIENYAQQPGSIQFMYREDPTQANTQFASHQVHDVGCEDDAEDSVLLQLQQMSLPHYCMLTLYQAIHHRAIHLTTELIRLAKLCVLSSMWLNKDRNVTEIASSASSVLDLLGNTIKQHRRCSQTHDETRLTYLQTLAVTRKFLVTVVPLELADVVLTRNLKSALMLVLLDYSLMCVHPRLHEDLYSYCKTFTEQSCRELLMQYEDTIKITKSMSAAVKFLRNYDKFDGKSVLRWAFEGLASLPLHKATSFVKLLLEVCLNKSGRWNLDKEAKEMATKIILRLLTSSERDIKRSIYSNCHKYITVALGVEQASRTFEVHHVSFLFDVDILREIITYGVTDNDKKISSCASEMLIHMLKGQMLMPKSLWQLFIQNLIPVLPLLLCHATKKSALGRTVVGMFNPELDLSPSIPEIEVLKGNILLLFSPEDAVRSEGASRLLWLLAHEESGADKLPEVAPRDVSVLSQLCMLSSPIDATRSQTLMSFYEINSLSQALEVLNSSQVEPRSAKTALTVLAALLEEPQLHGAFIERRGVETCLNVLKKVLIDKDFQNFPDSAIPIISILKNISFQNSKVRCMLSQDQSLYYCILRALLMFGTDMKLKQAVAVLLSLLVYTDYILSVPEGHISSSTSAWHPLSLPEIIARHMKLPFICKTHWRTSPHTQPNMFGALLVDDSCHAFLRLCWISEWHGGIKPILNWNHVQVSGKIEYAEALRITKADLDTLMSTCIGHCSKQCLFALQNATTHQAVDVALKRMLGYITLQSLIKEKSEVDGGWKTMPWESTLVRFFERMPVCAEDEELLTSLLQFLIVCIRHLNAVDIRKPQWMWIYRLLKDPNQPLPSMLKVESGLQMKNVCHEVVQLCEACCLLEHQLDEEENGKNKADVVSWVYIVQIMAENLKFSDTQDFYNLAFLDALLTFLSHATGTMGWFRGFSSSSPLLTELACYLVEIVNAFHSSKAEQSISNSFASFMGMNVTRNAVICMNHVLREMQNSASNRGWEMPFYGALRGRDMEDLDLTWIPLLWLSRDPVVRCSTLQLVSGLCTSQVGVKNLVQGLKGSPSSLWETALDFLLDHGEAAIVREQAAVILTNLSSHSITSNSSLQICVEAKSSDDNAKVSGLQALFAMLDEKGLFPEIATMTSNLYLEVFLKPDQWVYDPTFIAGPLHEVDLENKKNSEEDQSISTPSRESNKACVVTTPGLMKSLFWFLNNVITVSHEETIANVKKFYLIPVLFRSIWNMPTDMKTKREILLYNDILEMYTSVCTVLTKCMCVDRECLSAALNTNENVYCLYSLLNPALYNTRPDLILTRNRLWSRVFRLLVCFLTMPRGYRALMDVMSQNSAESFLSAIQISLNGNSFLELRNCSLGALTSLLSLETQNRQLCKDSILQYSVRSGTSSVSFLEKVLDKIGSSGNVSQEKTSENASGVSGAELCSSLLNQYTLQNVKFSPVETRAPASFTKASIVNALSSLLCVSNQAKTVALQEGLLENCVSQLQELHVRLSLEAVDNLRKATDKKHVIPILQEIQMLFGLLTNFLYGAPRIKQAAVNSSMVDTVHKLWVWCSLLPSLQCVALKLLVTFTSQNIAGSHCLLFTSSVLGVIPRKSPSTHSLLHEIVLLILREIEIVSKGYDTTILTIAFQVVKNSVHSQDCRNALFKTSFFNILSKLHPSLTKKQKPWDAIEGPYMEIMVECTFYPEGQLGLPKVADAMEVVTAFAENPKCPVRDLALAVYRNISFHHLNRPRLLSSNSCLQLLLKILNEGSSEGKNMAIAMVWALSANNQRAKIVMRSSGIASKLNEMLIQKKVLYERGGGDHESPLHMLKYVVEIVHGERTLMK